MAKRRKPADRAQQGERDNPCAGGLNGHGAGIASGKDEFFEALFTASEAVMMVLDPRTGDIVDVNPAAEHFYGYSAERMRAMNVGEINTVPREELRTLLEQAREQEKSRFRFRHTLADGDRRDVEVFSSPLDFRGQGVLFSIIHDITDRARVERALRESEELHRVILSSISDAVFLTDDEGSFVFVCPNVDIVFGHSPEEVRAMGNARELLGPDRFDPEKLAAEGELANIEHEIIDKFGEHRNLLVNIKRIDIIGATRLYSCRDFTERKRGEEALNRVFQEKELYRRNLEAMLQSIPDAVLTVDKDMRILYANDAARRICPHLAGEPGSDGVRRYGECGRSCSRILKQAVEEGRRLEDVKVVCRDEEGGSDRMLTINSAPLLYSGGEDAGVVMLIRDMSRMAELERRLSERQGLMGMVGKSKAVQDIYETIEHLGDVDSTVLVTGESGTGKELVVDALHYGGSRAGGPLVKVNCAALSENILESELFGHVKGAFTGALKDKKGRFQLAEGGTLFLDEIGEIPPRLQLKLLRGLEYKVFERVGDSRPYGVDVRIVAATNVDLEEKVASGRFREDLYYRLKVMVIHVPPLRERREDVPLLAEHFIEQFSRQFHKSIVGLEERALELLMQYDWPGNVRELKNTMERACILCPDSRIAPEHLSAELRGNIERPFKPPAPAVSGEIGPDRILRALDDAEGNKARAARALGIGRCSLYRRMKKYGIRP
jgi:PAS domain S-box-containing protein